MSHPSICIIGAGIAGLTLGRCLLHRGIPCVLYERDSLRQFNARHGYGITLHRQAYESLLPVLRLDETELVRRLAVDAASGGKGSVGKGGNAVSFRANRRRLEHMLVEGLDVRWEHKVADSKPSSDSEGLASIVFEDGERVHSDTVVGADGPHSQIRKMISPSSQFTILPYAVFNGKRRVSRAEYDEKYTPQMNGTVVAEQRVGNTLLQFSTNDVDEEIASISYTYSRPERSSDSLFKPDRPNAGASSIPDALFDEVGGLGDLPAPFNDVFDSKNMRGDRLLNWLMRSVLVPEADLAAAAAGGLVLIGDAAHHGPILGSYGANEAITDAMKLAECIAATSGEMKVQDFHQARYGRWQEYVASSEKQLAEMHGLEASIPRL